MEELTKEQVRRQDFVDNEINWMLTHLMEDLKPQDTSYGWNIEDIAVIRDIIFPILKSEYYGESTGFIPLEEMDFYPFIEEDEELEDWDALDRDWCDFCVMSCVRDEKDNCPNCGSPIFREGEWEELSDFVEGLIEESKPKNSGDYTECQSCHNPITWEVYAKNTGLCFECSDKIN